MSAAKKKKQHKCNKGLLQPIFLGLHLSSCFPVSGSMISADPRIAIDFVELANSATSKGVMFSAFLYEAKLSFLSYKYSTTSPLSFRAAEDDEEYKMLYVLIILFANHCFKNICHYSISKKMTFIKGEMI